MRKKLVVGNWKMHFNVSQSSHLLHRLQERIQTHNDVEVVLAPSFLVLQPLSLQIDRRKFKLAAQDCYWQDEGAFTGEISATMLHDLVEYIIVGHSERRHVFNETDEDVARKTAAVIRNGIVPIVCVGETAGERKDGETKQVLYSQLLSALKNVTSEDIKDLVIAYEPVWAIGKDAVREATPEEFREVAIFAKKVLSDKFGGGIARDIRIIYGGSVNPKNARDFVVEGGADGFLVGRDSLDAKKFLQIIQITRDAER